MPTTATEQLVKSLALYFLSNKTFNLSVLELLCAQQQIHASTTAEQIQSKIAVIDKAFVLIKQQLKAKSSKQSHKKKYQSPTVLANFYNMVNIYLFNVSTINEHYINEIEKQMAESTASHSYAGDLDKTFYKDKMAIGILKQHLRYYFARLTEISEFLEILIDETRQNVRGLGVWGIGVLQTLDYLSVKYEIKNQTTSKIIQILQKADDMHQSAEEAGYLKQIRELIFTESRKAEFYDILQTNPFINIKNITNLIIANYLYANPSRKIFTGLNMTGSQVAENVISQIIKRVDKNQLFNQKNQEYTPFKLIMELFFNKFFTVYLQFNSIAKQLMQLSNTEDQLNIFKKIQKIFRITIAIENPQFQQIIQFVYNALVKNYSALASTDLIKKLLLNRFFLNPVLYTFVNESSEQDIKKYVQIANSIRILFYPKKVEQFAHKTKMPDLIRISSQILYSLDYCLKKQKDSKLIIDNSKFLYINDKIIKGHMQQLYDQLRLSHPNKKSYSKDGFHANQAVLENSLSFSLVKNQQAHQVTENISQVGLQGGINQSNNNMKFSRTTRFMHDQLKSLKSQAQMDPKSPQQKQKMNKMIDKKCLKLPLHSHYDSKQEFGQILQLSKKQQQVSGYTQINLLQVLTDRQMIDELVELRKQYGEMKKIIKHQTEERKIKKMKAMSQLQLFAKKFNAFKKSVEQENNLIYLNMTSIA